MGTPMLHTPRSAVWRIASRQYDRITHRQLLGLGLSRGAIKHRVKRGTLIPIARGICAISRPRGTNEERWITAVLQCGDDAVLSHLSAACLWGFVSGRDAKTEVSVPAGVLRHPHAAVCHRRRSVLPAERRRRRLIPVTSAALTLVDCAPRLGAGGLETAVGKADSKNIVSVEGVRAAAGRYPRLPGAKLVRVTLDRRTFRVTQSELERELLSLIREAGLPIPETQIVLGTARVDFTWPELGLVVEVDGLRYHRTPVQQSADAKRDHAHQLAGRTPMRFSHAQVFFEPGYVVGTLSEVIAGLAEGDRRAA